MVDHASITHPKASPISIRNESEMFYPTHNPDWVGGARPIALSPPSVFHYNGAKPAKEKEHGDVVAATQP
jgi:hypothetical protein